MNRYRTNGPFIAQNCAAIPETLLESILFGTAKGSYTGAVERKGLFELADGGTLFLDELHTMPIELQAKLLRVLEDGMVRSVGGAAKYLCGCSRDCRDECASSRGTIKIKSFAQIYIIA